MTNYYNKHSEKAKRRKLQQDQTYVEKLVWRFLRNRQLSGYKFRRQFSFDHFIIDFYCPELKLAVEVDGGSHNEPGQQRKISGDKSIWSHLILNL